MICSLHRRSTPVETGFIGRTSAKFASAAFAFISSAVVGCAPTHVQVVQEYMGPLPRPDRVIVFDFAVAPSEVNLDQGVSAKVASYMQGGSPTEQELQVGHAVASALTKHLVEELKNAGVPAFPAYENPSYGGTSMAVQGHFISIDQGNRTERVMIGLGMGRTDVRTITDLRQFVDGAPRIVAEFESDAKSGYKPGMAETMGAGAIAGHLGTSAIVGGALAVGSEAFSANVDADARRTAKKLSNAIVEFFRMHGWLN